MIGIDMKIAHKIKTLRRNGDTCNGLRKLPECFFLSSDDNLWWSTCSTCGRACCLFNAIGILIKFWYILTIHFLFNFISISLPQFKMQIETVLVRCYKVEVLLCNWLGFYRRNLMQWEEWFYARFEFHNCLIASTLMLWSMCESHETLSHHVYGFIRFTGW